MLPTNANPTRAAIYWTVYMPRFVFRKPKKPLFLDDDLVEEPLEFCFFCVSFEEEDPFEPVDLSLLVALGSTIRAREKNSKN